MASPQELVRVVAGAGGSLVVGRERPGRGAWICSGSPACVDAAERRKAFDRALRISLQPGAVDAVRPMLAERGRLES